MTTRGEKPALLGALLLAAALVAACGTLARTDGGAENLPSRRILPFDKPVPDEGDDSALPFVLFDDTLELDEPSALVVDGRIVLFTQAADGDSAVIQRAESDDGLAFDAPRTIFEPELAWEEGWVGAPTVLERQGTLYLYYVGGRTAPAIGLARSTDGSIWTREAEPVLTPESDERLDSPSAVLVGANVVLFFSSTIVGDAEDPPPTVIDRADSPDGVSFERKGSVLNPDVGCTDYDGNEVRCWDEDGVSAPGARVTTSPADRTLIDIWYTGVIGESTGIGFVGSYDGLTFSRYKLNPIVNASTRERAAVVVAHGESLFMYFSDLLDGRRAIGVAIQE